MAITQFRGEYFFLSNFYPAEIVYMGEIWPTSEHAYQAQKFNDPTIRTAIREAKTPAQAKRIGNKFPCRSDWEQIRVKAMLSILYAKFMQHEDILHKLKATGEQQIIENNSWHDTFWGVCNGKGENQLGKLLMQLRTTL